MSWVRVAGLGVSLAGAVALPAWMAAGCSSSSTGFGGSSGALFSVPGGSSGQSSGSTGFSGSSGTIGTGPGSTTSTSGQTSTSSTNTTCTTDTGPISGSVAYSGGSVSRLVFAVVGDTRPNNEGDVSGYPTSIINPIFTAINGLSPKPVLALGTGDYQFSSASDDSAATQQIGLFMTARQGYSGPFFPAMGNHECGVSGPYSTSDNNDCGPGNPGGPTANYNAFVDGMMTPITGQSLPYYSVNVNDSAGKWTAKFVVTAANAWSTAQQTWLTTTMAQHTTYTFVIRHEASDATPPIPDCIPTIDSIISAAGYTLLIVGHTHDYGHYASSSPQTVVFGNGGAPISSSNYEYGFGLFSQRCDGAIVVSALDQTGAVISSAYDFPFAITAAGQLTN